MTTSFTEVFDLFLTQVKDYNLINLYTTSVTNFNNYLEGWLLPAIVDFHICNQNINTYDLTLGQFTETLTLENKMMLARIMVKYWLTKEVQDIMQMNLHVLDRDFKMFSEAQNLREKSVHLDKVKESVSQELVEYGYRNNKWSDWLLGNFGV